MTMRSFQSKPFSGNQVWETFVRTKCVKCWNLGLMYGTIFLFLLTHGLNLICRGVKLPSRRPALVCESCFYSQDAQKRVRAFHVLDPRGLLDVIGVFHESRDDSSFAESQRDLADEPSKRIEALLGRWSGQLVTRRTSIYGSTLAQCNVQVCYERDEEAKMKLVLLSNALPHPILFFKTVHISRPSCISFLFSKDKLNCRSFFSHHSM
jgi:hypothetical protein